MSKNKTMYKIIFTGRLAKDVTQEQAIKNVMHLTRSTEEQVRLKLFSGKPSVIKKSCDTLAADHLKKQFDHAGLILQFKEVSANKNAKKKQLLWLKYLFVLMILVTIAAAGLFWLNNQLTIKTPDKIASLEQHFLQKDPVIMGHINFDAIRSLQQLARKEALNDKIKANALYQSFFSGASSASMQPLKSVKQIFYVAQWAKDKEKKGKLIHQLYISGHFSPAIVKQFLMDEKEAVVSKNNNVLRIYGYDEKTCKKVNPVDVFIDKEYILVSSTGHIKQLQEVVNAPIKLQIATQALSKNSQYWLEYRKEKLMSFAVFSADKNIISGQGMGAYMARGLIQQNEAINGLFSGLSPQLYPTGLSLNVSAMTQDRTWIKQNSAKLQKNIETLITQSEDLPALIILLKQISIMQSEHALEMNMLINNELVTSIEQSITDLLGGLFSVKPVQHNNQAASTNNAVTPDHIDNYAKKYVASGKLSRLPTFDKKLDVFLKPQWTKGPFALELSSLMLADNNQIQIQLIGKAQNIKNMSDTSAYIEIKQVNDHNNNNLIQKEMGACGVSKKDKNNRSYFKASSFEKTTYIEGKKVSYVEASSSKAITLTQGVDIEQFKSIEGVIYFNNIVDIETLVISKPDKAQLLEKYGSKLTIAPSDSGTLRYALQDKDERVLDIRALNKDKKYLMSSGSMASNGMFSQEKSTSKYYSGTIAYIEVVYVKEKQAEQYPFKLAQLPPGKLTSKWFYQAQDLPLVDATHWDSQFESMQELPIKMEAWYKEQLADLHTGVFNLALYQLKTSQNFGTTGQLVVKMPILEELRNNLTALEMVIKFSHADHNGKKESRQYVSTEPEGYYNNGTFMVSNNQPYIQKTLPLNLPYKNSKKALDKIKGELLVRLPSAVMTKEFDSIQLGSQWQLEGVIAKLIEVSTSSMKVAITGEHSKLLQLYFINNKGEIVSKARQGQSSKMIINISLIDSHPSKVVMKVAQSQVVKHYPFQLDVKQ